MPYNPLHIIKDIIHSNAQLSKNVEALSTLSMHQYDIQPCLLKKYDKAIPTSIHNFHAFIKFAN